MTPMAEPDMIARIKKQSDVASQRFGGEGNPPLNLDVVVGDKVKITVDGTIGTIMRIVPRASARLVMADGTERMVPLGYLEKVS